MRSYSGVPLDGLGMDDKAMLELTNRLNKHTDAKWVLNRHVPFYGYQNQMLNPLGVGYQSQAAVGI